MNGDAIIKAIDEISEKAGEKMQYKTFYLDDKGLRHCIACKRKLETLISIPSLGVYDKKVNCVCDCGKAQRDAYRAEAQRVNRANEIRISDVFSVPEYAEMIFSKDDDPKSEKSLLCRRWVAHYDANRDKGNLKWLFLYGEHGTGKTFYSACIANTMAAKGYHVKMVTASELANRISTASDKTKIFAEYNDYEIVIIEDIDVDDEKLDTIFAIINNRSRNNQTMIITSCQTTEQTVNPKSDSMKRIMDIIYSKGFPIEFTKRGTQT
jgi:DNA replication protein DnaC